MLVFERGVERDDFKLSDDGCEVSAFCTIIMDKQFAFTLTRRLGAPEFAGVVGKLLSTIGPGLCEDLGGSIMILAS